MKSYSGGIRHDYKDSDAESHARPFSNRTLNHPRLHWFACGLAIPLAAVALMLFSEPNESMVASDPVNVPTPRIELAMIPAAGERIRLQLPPPASAMSLNEQPQRTDELERSALLEQGEAIELRVRSGDSLDLLFGRNDLSRSDLAEMVALPEVGRDLARIRPGDQIEIIRDGSQVLALSRELSESQQLWITRDGEGFAAELIDLEIEIRTAGAHGVIESSLYEAAHEVGLTDDVTEQIWKKIFEWDIDFWLDIRRGDSFTVVYEEKWRDGVKLGNGNIIAAEFVNQGKTHRAARFVDTTGNAGYFTPEGMNVQRPFLMNPVEFTRISSGFNPARRHPISNQIRAHRGVDLAAPTGTPVRAAGDGKIIALGANGSYGNRVEIQHGGGITTLYAHLNSFGKFRNGDRVEQSDIIGYVGMTGGATGPHLHYEYRISGVHQNPRTVDLPDAEPIAREYLADFQATTAGLWRQLDLYQSTLLARNDP